MLLGLLQYKQPTESTPTSYRSVPFKSLLVYPTFWTFDLGWGMGMGMGICRDGLSGDLLRTIYSVPEEGSGKPKERGV